jgi:single-strand DNA-binding protein
MQRKTIILGYLGSAPQLNTTDSGTSVTSARVGTQTQRDEDTVWVNVVAFGQPAEFLAEYGEKGKVIYAEGRVQLDTWTDDDGNQRSSLEVVADEINLPRQGQNSGPAPGPSDDAPNDDDIPF